MTMDVTATLTKPSLKVLRIKDGESVTELKVIEAKVLMPYSTDLWKFLGANVGDALDCVIEPSQGEMFDKSTGEIKKVK